MTLREAPVTPKDILIVVDGAKRRAAFAAGEALAKRWSPHVSCLQMVEIPDPSTSVGMFTTAVWAQLLEEMRKRAALERTAIAEHLRAFAGATEIAVVERSLSGLPRAVAERAMHADLTIMQRPDTPAAIAAFEAALFDSGRPVLLAPPDWNGGQIGRRVMVAWSAKRESARALADAGPFLEGADDISVVAVDASAAYEGDTFDGYDISAHLARHGLKVSLRKRDSFGRSTDRALLDEARDCGADLIVMGGYGHSRLREYVLGGVTRALIASCPLPILISH